MFSLNCDARLFRTPFPSGFIQLVKIHPSKPTMPRVRGFPKQELPPSRNTMLHVDQKTDTTLQTVLAGVLLIIASFAVWIFNQPRMCSLSKMSQVEADLKSFESALAMYRLKGGGYPSASQGLEALVVKPMGDPVPERWSQILDKVWLDPWGAPYHYEFPGRKDPKTPEIISSGPDSIRGTSDDLSSEDE